MTARRAGVMGWPIAHSKSPDLHGYWLRKYGVDGAYEHVPSPPEMFSADVRQLVAKGWRGANVTLPHKEAALRGADDVTDRAREIGAANTLVFQEDGTILADNTDGFGFFENIRTHFADGRIDRPVALLGAGGAARAVIWALLDAGAPEIRIANRTRDRAEALRGAFGRRIRVFDWAEAERALPETGLVVNTTSLGMTGAPPLSLDLGAVPDDALATDIVYTPLITPFLTSAAERGLATMDGLGMLLHQARPGFAAWFGVEPEVDDALREIMLRR